MNRVYYSAFMLLALAVFLLVRRFMPRPEALVRAPLLHRIILGMCAFIGGAFGAKLPFVLGVTGGEFSPLGWLADGKTITTGLMGAYLGVEMAKLLVGIHGKTGDSFALPLACAMAVGRWGCFFNGCCFGTPTELPWGCDFGLEDGLRRHPTQAYESVFHLMMAVVLWFCVRHRLFVNNQLKLYLIAYGLYRFLTEFIRPEPALLLGLTFYQWASVVMIVGLSVQWWFDQERTARPVISTSIGAEPGTK